MTLTKQQLNKKLKSKVLQPKDLPHFWIRNVEIRVERARVVPPGRARRLGRVTWKNKPMTMATIKIKAEVQDTKGRWMEVGNRYYGPKHIRNFLRRNQSGIKKEVSSWVRLWGFPSEVELDKIELIRSTHKI